MKSGVYKIVNTITGKTYIGSSIDIKTRFNRHKSALSRNKHPNPILQASWIKHGSAAFIFEVLEWCSPAETMDRETTAILTHKTLAPLGYNLTSDASKPRLGKSWDKEARNRFSAANIGRDCLPPEVRKSLNLRLIGIAKPTSGKRKHYTVLSPNNEVINIIGLRQFCKDKGLPYSRMNVMLNKKTINGYEIKNILGWKCYNPKEKNTQG